VASQLVLLPGAPVVVPELSRAAWSEVEALYDAGLRALRTAATSGAEVRVIVHGTEVAVLPRIRHDLRRWGAPDVPIGPNGAPSPEEAGIRAEDIPGAALIAWWWLQQAGPGFRDEAVETHVVAGSAESVAELIASAPGTVVLIADGPAALAPKAPIPERPSAVALDAGLTEFIEAGTTLPDHEDSEAARDGWYTAPLWRGAAAAVGRRPAADSAQGAPFGVGYHVARWVLASATAAIQGAAETEPGPGQVQPIVVIGPTGTGKSELAMDLAERFGGQIVNLDAMQLYKGMDIGTAKVPPAERRGIAHHMFDVLEVTETASVADYQRDARAIVEEIMAAGAVPVVVGGSMLYYQSLLDEWEFPETDPEVRAKYERRLDEIGVEALHAELAAIDPEAAATILPSDPRRTVRALEVVEITGKPFAASRPRIGRQRWGAHLLGLDVPTAELDERLERRTAAMFDSGLVAEVRALESAGLRDGVTARRAIGYAQVLAAIDESAGADPAGEQLDEAVYRTFVGTRRYVRRQRSWFRRDERITWLDASAAGRERLLDAALDAIGDGTKEKR